MKCSKCGENKPEYHFFKHRNNYNTEFFLNIVPNEDTCWTCSGPYRCIICEQIKDASAFRVGGRVCHDCKLPQEGQLARSGKRRL